MRFDTSEMGDIWTEICAYGTAVVAVPVTDGARADRASSSATARPRAPQQPAPVGSDAYGGGQ